MCASPPSYSSRFSTSAQAASYDQLYAPGTRDRLVWELQRPFLRSVVRRLSGARGGIRALDFACGTGRVLAEIEDLAEVAHGVDISDEMVILAREHCRDSTIFVGDITRGFTLPCDAYDLVTAFRFFLNVEPEQRLEVLAALHSVLAPVDGFLVFNNHGNRTSARQLALMNAASSQPMKNSMSARGVSELLEAARFRVVAKRGYSLLPDVAHRSPIRSAARSLERLTSETQLASWIGIDQLYVAQAV
jgi:SAM-dependent methyltransferase